MKIGVLSGAYKNAGDFLIVNRSIALLKYILGDIEIEVFLRNQDLTPKLNEINNCDVLVLAGGPGYIPNVYPDIIPLVPNLDDIQPKIFILGMGWFGANTSNEYLYNYRFNESSKKLFTRVIKDGFLLGCRDYESAIVLKNNNIYDTVVTGCPAWYNLDVITNDFVYNFEEPYRIENIYISDPANVKNYSHVINLINYLFNRFPSAKIKYIFHRGIKADKYTNERTASILLKFCRWLESNEIEYHDISYSDKGFSLYDDCDLHIGFRVHAHIYNLSNRKLSILFEEDARGAGVNNALGLKNITTYNNRTLNILNEYLINNLDDYLFELESNNYYRIQNAFANMKNHFDLMVEHIQMIKQIN